MLKRRQAYKMKAVQIHVNTLDVRVLSIIGESCLIRQEGQTFDHECVEKNTLPSYLPRILPKMKKLKRVLKMQFLDEEISSLKYLSAS